MTMNAKTKALRDAYYAAAAAEAAYRASDDAYRAANVVAYRAAHRVDVADRAAAAADRVAVAAWDAYQAALKAAEKGGKP